MTRQEWLTAIAKELLPIFVEAAAPVSGKIRIVCAIDEDQLWGKCSPKSTDNLTQILVSPRIHKPVDAAATVVHELVHAAVGCEHQHTEPFRRVALRVGLKGPMTATSPGAKLVKRLRPLMERVGPYPPSDIIEIDRASYAAHIARIAPHQIQATAPTTQLPNTQLTPQMIAAELLLRFKNNLATSTVLPAVRERRMYHRQTRELRIVYTDAEVAALGYSWWEWTGNNR
jgi:hypothetical protein